ncbi:hypothetical protein C2845_PM09G23870 [Panicum miliaceum]|uniref:Exocyst subunit Exo70 family protein n=1 Tax=Panicum miliaceum TaxID=4540 RepID=A0A3L6S2Q8_PANMI|nr:hypothetical protein C2845_PM09G23870 [Panicum miliaceum]
MAVASVWWGSWIRSRVFSSAPRRAGGGGDVDGGGGSLQPIYSESSTSGSGTTTTVTISFDSAKERPRAFNSSMVLPKAPVVEENVEELDMAKVIEEDRMRKLEHLKGLVVEFCGGNNPDALEKWLSELDVGWVLHKFKIDESAGSIRIWRQFQYFAESWILALQDINESISKCFDVWCSQDRDKKGTSKKPLASEFALLVEATVLEMLPFVDAIIAAAARTSGRPEAIAAADKLQVLIDVRNALSMASEQFLLSLFSSSPCVQSTGGKMRENVSAHLARLDETIWNTMVAMMTGTAAWTAEDNGGCGHPCGSSDIHQVTRSIIRYIKVLRANYRSLDRILDDANLRGEFKPDNESGSHLNNLIMEMVHSTEDKLVSKSKSWFEDQSLRFLFLINNSYFMLRLVGFPMPVLTRRIDDYINGYLIVSWVPVLRCLRDPATLRCFARTSSPLTKFQSKFHKTYAAQKLWKVPHPYMRKMLRKAIVEKVIPVFTQFLEDNSISTPGVTPKKLEEMLGELFEG